MYNDIYIECKYSKIDDLGYVLSEKGGDCMGKGLVALFDNEECKRAAVSLGKVFVRIEENAKWPKNCYICTSNLCKNRVYWNNHNTGKKNALAQEICRKSKRFLV